MADQGLTTSLGAMDLRRSKTSSASRLRPALSYAQAVVGGPPGPLSPLPLYRPSALSVSSSSSGKASEVRD
jgi:hypothetical protein